ncbi:hypothetical protein [Rosistilla oblonga]|uniref:hypothetical protein n=1 Tax=Rosistilla oblonga TaxID=2527990 RepID=UPI001E3BEFEC|nr:hypothetical protein [Rosistilla oblonga]
MIKSVNQSGTHGMLGADHSSTQQSEARETSAVGQDSTVNPYQPPRSFRRLRPREKAIGFPAVLILSLASVAAAVGVKGMRDVYLYQFQPNTESWVLSWGPVACTAISVPLIVVIAMIAIICKPKFSRLTWLAVSVACLSPAASLVLLFA